MWTPGSPAEPPVVLRVRESGAVEQYVDWAHVGTGTVHYRTQSGRHDLWTGLDTTADAGVALLSNGLEALTGTPPTDWLPSRQPDQRRGLAGRRRCRRAPRSAGSPGSI